MDIREVSGVRVIDIAFCAGFIEGEGWMTPPAIKRNGTMASGARIAACQVVREPLCKLQDIFGGTIIVKKAQKHKHPHWQDQYVWSVYGNKAIGIMMTIYPFMSDRRKERIRICIDLWRQHRFTKPMEPEVTEAVQMYKEGKSTREIAQVFGVHPTTVLEWLHGRSKNGVPLALRDAPKRLISEDVVVSAIKRVLCGETRINVAKSIGEDYFTVAAWLNGKSRPHSLLRAKQELALERITSNEPYQSSLF